MLFNSAQFLLFFPLVTILYFGVPHKYRWVLLLVVSCYFYMAFVPVYILILAFTITIDYAAGMLIENAAAGWRKLLFGLSIIANVGILAVFKYASFLSDNLVRIAAFFDLNYPLPHLALLLPIGLSFHTFQSLSYTIEVYRGNQRAERHFGIFALYVMFYPQLVAGPIERPQNLLRQFREEHFFEYQRVADGLKRMAWGFFKKLVVADSLAVHVNQVYGDPTSFGGINLIIATVFFSIQIYGDFSGYSDIAIGAAQVMGIKLMENFRRPYFAGSVADFWHRWHISLSTWFKDYVYIPLGGSRVSRLRHYFNLFVTFLVSGLWHGANWTFVIWGALHGLFMVIPAAVGKSKAKATRPQGPSRIVGAVKVTTTFALVCFAWIFFRASNLGDAWYIATNLHRGVWHFMVNLHDLALVEGTMHSMGLYGPRVCLLIGAVSVLGIVEAGLGNELTIKKFRSLPFSFRLTSYYALVLSILLLGEFNRSPFIYFQF